MLDISPLVNYFKTSLSGNESYIVRYVWLYLLIDILIFFFLILNYSTLNFPSYLSVKNFFGQWVKRYSRFILSACCSMPFGRLNLCHLLMRLESQMFWIFLFLQEVKYYSAAPMNVSGLRRNIKNIAHNYTDAQVRTLHLVQTSWNWCSDGLHFSRSRCEKPPAMIHGVPRARSCLNFQTWRTM